MTERTDKTAGAAADVIGQALDEVKVKKGTLASFVEAQAPEIAKALPGGLVDAERYVRLVQTELRKNPALMSCTPQSFLGAVLTAAQLGLEFGPMQQAYMVPFKKEITLIIGYKGWLKLIHNSAEIQSVSARTVFERDEFDYGYGLDEYLIHKPAKGERGAPVGYYAVIRKTNGGRSFAYMTHDEMVAHANRYAKRGGKLTGPWVDEFETMAWKTCFLRAKVWVPASTEALAQEVDNRVVNRMDFATPPTAEEPGDDEDVVDAEVVEPDLTPEDEADAAWVSDAQGQ